MATVVKNGILGITGLSIHHGVDEAVKIQMELIAQPGYDPHHLLNEKWDDIFPGNVIVKCSHCGQFAARKTACKHCGAPVG